MLRRTTLLIENKNRPAADRDDFVRLPSMTDKDKRVARFDSVKLQIADQSPFLFYLPIRFGR